MWTWTNLRRLTAVALAVAMAWMIRPAATVADTLVDLQVMVWALPDMSDVEMDFVLTEFEEEHGIVIDLIRAADRESYDVYLDELREGGPLPDLLLVDPDRVRPMAERGELAAIDLHFAHPEDLPVRLPDELLDRYRFDGFLFGVPMAEDDEGGNVAYAIAQDALEQGRGDLAFDLLRRLADALPAYEDEGFRNERTAYAEGGIDGENAEIARILTPVTMYYIERYFHGMAERTDLDDEIEAILTDSPEGQEVLAAALEVYQEMPLEMKLELFDEEAMMLISDNDSWGTAEFGGLADRVHGLQTVAAGATTPAAPGNLAATNQAGGPDAVGQDKYKVGLAWTDNSGAEDGFLIFRRDAHDTTATPVQVGSTSANVTSFTDYLTCPNSATDMMCYHVVAYTTPAIQIAGQPAVDLHSDSSNTDCSYYAMAYPQPPKPTDTDGDGLPDIYDDCPTDHAGKSLSTNGCPDIDGDGIADKDDHCPQDWGDYIDGGDSGPRPLAGCPLKYTLRWMDMTVLNNTLPYRYSHFNVWNNDGTAVPDEGADPYGGEEPYLHFRLVNGVSNMGMPQAWNNRWCCGDGIDVKSGHDYEPDNDSTGEEFPNDLADLQAYGMTILPGIANASPSEIDRDLGLLMNITLMERDWSTTVTLDQSIGGLEAAIKVGGAVVAAFSSCVGSGGVTCMKSVGLAIKSIIETVLGLSKSPVHQTVKDPDDFMGSDVWAMSRYEARMNTSSDGAYGFWFEMPTKFHASCLGWQPCSVSISTPVEMRARIQMCLVREGVAESQVKTLCAPYTLTGI